jgi:hypothetical protein
VGYEYLDLLGVPAEVREKLRRLGAPNALALRYIIDASPEAFINLVGECSVEKIKRALDAQVNEADRNAAEAVPEQDFGLGARLEDPPTKR